MVATSTDGGARCREATADQALIEPPARPASSRVEGRRPIASGWSSRTPRARRRERLTVRLSEDERHDVARRRVVHHGPAAYSSLPQRRPTTRSGCSSNAAIVAVQAHHARPFDSQWLAASPSVDQSADTMTISTPRSSISRHAWIVVALLVPVALLNYLDRQMLASMKFSVMRDIPDIALEANWGAILATFKWVYAGLSPIGGYLADRYSAATSSPAACWSGRS